jgi:ABC-type branched-subunit amino acid transport system ATPase component
VNLLTGALTPNAGEVRLAGRDITRVGQAARAKLGIARTFQINRLFRRLTVLENVYIAVAERGAPPRPCFDPPACGAMWSTSRCICWRP